ncbi:MAG: SDR family oxidoreductase [Rhodobacteraceae bacterium]|nr:SDR family oxidoreductase [Paracoccaceae bacterium]MBR9823934.1 SDR family oxidoreductase [Paracoccaceae bacterium]
MTDIYWTPSAEDLPTPANRMKGRAVLITGAASGIGAAIARTFAAEGAQVALLDIVEAPLLALADEIGGHAVPFDLSQEEGLTEAVNATAEAMGHLDGLVNGAGVHSAGAITDIDPAEWHRVMQVNLTAPFLVCRAAVPHMRAAPGPFATVLNLSSGMGLSPYAERSCYATSKGGLITLGKVLAKELAPKIRVNTICPGLIDTPMVAKMSGHNDLTPTLEKYALKRLGHADEIAQAALFLCSSMGSFVTGITMAVDGGRTFH